MSRTEDLINLSDHTTTPPPTYPNLLVQNQNRQQITQMPISHHQNNHLYPNYPSQLQPQIYASPIHPNAPQYPPVSPFIDISKLPLSMQRNYYIQNNYPTGYIIFHSISLLILALSMIAAEISFFYYSNQREAVNQLGGGLYSGGFMILTVFITLISISCRNFCVMMTSVLSHLVTLIITFSMNVIFHAISVGIMDCTLDQDSCQNNAAFLLGIFLIGSGLLAIFMCLVFSIYVQVKVVGVCSKKNINNSPIQTRYYPNGYYLPQNGFANPNFQ
ncbi:unnamed protein product [Brachionus calyciflorus]|uniref:Uncharacterized protein n=1 Tax=Brachionus calyciflorus TaxID=104777 RepID=A0A813SZF5_9BILA|nr:unnamed protein product [Brachionus calyciflorus]